MKTGISLFLFCAIGQLSAQTTLSGLVTLQNTGHQSAFPTQVKSFGATTTDVRSADGHFELVYDLKKPGQEASLEIIKAGYEVVNREDLFLLLPRQQDRQKVLRIFLCPQGQWQRYADQYYRVNLGEINKNYEQELGRLRKKYAAVTFENEEYRQALARLDDARKIAEAEAHNLAEKFAKTNLDDATDRYVAAHRLFTAGKIDSVLLLLKESEILADIDRAKGEVARGRELVRIGQGKMVNGLEAKERIIEEFMVKARAHVIKFQWEAAERAYTLAVRTDSMNVRNLSELAEFLFNLNQFDKALPFWGRCLGLAETKLDSAKYLNNIGLIQYSKKEYGQTTKTFNQVSRIYSELTDEHAVALLPEIASAINNFALLFEAKSDFKMAESANLEALKIRKQLAEDNPEIYEADVAISLNNLGSFYLNHKEYAPAEEMLKQALEIRERLAKDNPEKFNPEIAATMNNLASVYAAQGQFKPAEKYFLLAIDFYEQLVESKPHVAKPNLASNFYNLATLYAIKADYFKAEAAYQRATTYYLELAATNPETYEPEYVDVLHNQAVNYLNKNEFERAETLLVTAVAMMQELVREYPEVYKPKLLALNLTLADLYSTTHDYSSTERVLLETLALGEELLTTDPNVYTEEVEKILNNLGVFYADNQDFRKAETVYWRAVQLNANLKGINKKIDEPNLANTLNNLAVLYYTTRNLARADSFYQAVLPIYYRLLEENRQTYEPAISSVWNNMGVLYNEMDLDSKSDSSYKQALAIRQKLFKADSLAYGPDLATTLNNLGSLYLGIDDVAAAKRYFLSALDINEFLSRINFRAFGANLGLNLGNLGVVYKDLEEFESSEKCHRRALTIYRDLEQLTGQSYAESAALNFQNLGNLYMEQYKYAEAESNYLDALNINKKLSESDPQVYNLEVTRNLFSLADYAYKRLSAENDSIWQRRGLAWLQEAYSRISVYPDGDPQKQAFVEVISSLRDMLMDYDAVLFALKPGMDIIRTELENATSEAEKVRLTQKLIALLEQGLRKNPDYPLLLKTMGDAYGQLSWHQLLVREFASAEKSARKGLELAPEQNWIYSNLAPALLFQGKWREAETVYRKWKDKPFNDESGWDTVFLSDLDTLQAAGITHPDVVKARTLLKQQ